jgi:thiamine pyrophosphate-dependent acetolactate synthase large subunit-like protein
MSDEQLSDEQLGQVIESEVRRELRLHFDSDGADVSDEINTDEAIQEAVTQAVEQVPALLASQYAQEEVDRDPWLQKMLSFSPGYEAHQRGLAELNKRVQDRFAADGLGDHGVAFTYCRGAELQVGDKWSPG